MKANETYARLVAKHGFKTVRVTLDLTARELNVLLAWERSKAEADTVHYAVDLRDGMVDRMVAVDDLLDMGYEWTGECAEVITNACGDDWLLLTETPNGKVVELEYLLHTYNQANWGYAG
jgi:hypothetical protein